MTTRSIDRANAPKDDHNDHQAACTKIGAGARAMNRLLLSLWFLLIPMVWPSSDWIGLIILSQAFFVAANLVRPATANSSAAVSLEGTVLNVTHVERNVESDSDMTSTDARDFRLNLKYLGESRLELRGSSTGEMYLFTTELRVQPVDLRDARFLLASPLFTIA